MTLFFPNNNRLVPTYLLALVDLSIFWSYGATVSATPLSVALDSVKRHKGMIK
jgi:hypothetical protein